VRGGFDTIHLTFTNSNLVQCVYDSHNYAFDGGKGGNGGAHKWIISLLSAVPAGRRAMLKQSWFIGIRIFERA
jgi:hypothetical protein